MKQIAAPRWEWLGMFGTVAAGLLGAGVLCSTTRAQLPAPAPPADRYQLVRCGRLLAVPGKPVQTDVTLVLKNGKVDSISPGLSGPDLSSQKSAGAEVNEIDLRDMFVLPGLIDCHVHLTHEFDTTVRQRLVTESDEFVAIHATVFAKRTLEAGFTTVRDLGANAPTSIFALRDAINAGLVPGPRIIAAGHAITMTGGHADFTLGFRPDVFGPQSPENGIADGPEECMKAVRNQVKLGADVIKVTATGGVLSAAASGTGQHFFDDELGAIVKAAHSVGRKVAAHAHGTDGINAAIRAGVDSIEHGTFLDDESLKLFKEHNCYHVPTLLAGATVAANSKIPGYYLASVAKKGAEVGPKAMDAFRKSHAAGVKIAFGTDTGVSVHGQNAREFSLMVEGGMTPAEAITAATRAASELLGLSTEIGTLEAGKYGDVIAVKGDPLKDVSELERITFVMKAGVVVKGPGKP